MLKPFSLFKFVFFVTSFFCVVEFGASAPKPRLNDVENEKVLAVLYSVREAFDEAELKSGAQKMELFKAKIEVSLKENILPTLLFVLIEQSQVKEQIKVNDQELLKQVNDTKLNKKAKDLASELARLSNLKNYIVKNLRTHISLPWSNDLNMENLKKMGILYSKSKNKFTIDEEKLKATTAVIVNGISLKMDENSDSHISDVEFSTFTLDVDSSFGTAIEYLNR